MKHRKSFFVIIALLVSLLLAAAVAGKMPEGMISGEQGYREEQKGAAKDTSEDPTVKVIESAVIIESGDLVGCGNVWETDGDIVTVITASHVIADEEDVRVRLANGDVLGAEALRNDTESDYCFLRVKAGDVSGVTGIVRADDLPQAGAEVFMALPFLPESASIGTVGLDKGESGPAVSKGVVISPGIYSEDLTMDVIYCSIDVSEGMSGGGLFDDKGRYLGFLIGGSDEAEGMFLPVVSIVQ